MSNAISRDVLQNWVVLVVDDDIHSIRISSMILKHYGANVHTASDGAQGLAIARETRPRFIIADLSMPVMDGWTMIDRLKKDRTTLDIPIIALTAHAMVGDRERAIAAGCHNYMTKPLTPATFMQDLLYLLVDVPQLSALLNQKNT
jgi:CheY-like chemotaxis protein